MKEGEGEGDAGRTAEDILQDHLLGDGPPPEPPTDEPPVDEPPVDEPPVDTPPPTDEPPVDEPPVDEPPVDEPEAFDFSSLGFEGVTNKVEWDALNMPGRLSRLEELEKVVPVLEDRVKSNANPYANETIAKYSESVKAGLDLDYGLFQELDRFDDQASDNGIEAMVLDTIIKTPALASRRSELRDSLEKKYGINAEKWAAEAEANGEEYRPQLSDIDLIRDSQTALQSLRGEKAKIKPYEAAAAPDVSAEAKERLALHEEKVEKWGNLASTIARDVKSLPIVRGENGFTATVDPKWLADNKDMIRDMAVNNNLNLDKEGVSQLTDYVAGMYLLSNKAAVLEEYGKKLKTEWQKSQDTELNGAPPINTNRGREGEGDISREDALHAYLSED